MFHQEKNATTLIRIIYYGNTLNIISLYFTTHLGLCLWHGLFAINYSKVDVSNIDI